MNLTPAECVCGEAVQPKPILILGPYLSLWIACSHCGLDIVATVRV